MQNRIALADVGEKFISQPLAFRRALNEPCDIRKLNCGTDNLLRLCDLSESIKTLIRHFHNSRIRFNRAEGIVFCRSLLLFSQRIEQS